jgi:8-amino-7-oxononanoate synthase
VGAALAALDVLTAEPGLPVRARDRARRIWGRADEVGLRTTDPAAAVVAVILGDPRDALRAAEICAAHGVRVGCFRPPSVPAGRACLRITAPASLTEADLTVLGKALGQVAGDVARYAPGAPGVPYARCTPPEDTGSERDEREERP